MSDASASDRIPLEAKVAFLQRAASFPEGAERIEAMAARSLGIAR